MFWKHNCDSAVIFNMRDRTSRSAVASSISLQLSVLPDILCPLLRITSMQHPGDSMLLYTFRSDGVPLRRATISFFSSRYCASPIARQSFFSFFTTGFQVLRNDGYAGRKRHAHPSAIGLVSNVHKPQSRLIGRLCYFAGFLSTLYACCESLYMGRNVTVTV